MTKIRSPSLDAPANYCVYILKFCVRVNWPPCALEMNSNGGLKQGHVKHVLQPLQPSLVLQNQIFTTKIGSPLLDIATHYCVYILKFCVWLLCMPCALEINTNRGLKWGHVESWTLITKKIISSLPQCLWPPNVGGWWFAMRDSHLPPLPGTLKNLWSRGLSRSCDNLKSL